MKPILTPDAFSDPEALRRCVIAAVRRHAASDVRGAYTRFCTLEDSLRRELLIAGISDANDGLARGLLLAAHGAAGVPAPKDLD